ncbi:hypothetical protein Pla52o_22520 [Novipirellula galeiformis]|uniref:Uncharacterized protein n=1 Tax=Novipirellula galeiformis TaxID=2528004 RepID=A0A5C6CJP5_9BACT|nr:hypothetical protein Pla52o_22520 [Novipirellula galeiformis]
MSFPGQRGVVNQAASRSRYESRWGRSLFQRDQRPLRWQDAQWRSSKTELPVCHTRNAPAQTAAMNNRCMYKSHRFRVRITLVGSSVRFDLRRQNEGKHDWRACFTGAELHRWKLANLVFNVRTCKRPTDAPTVAASS